MPVYLSRNVLLYTHYSGDVATVVDTHFTKALNQTSFQDNKGGLSLLKFCVVDSQWNNS